MFAVNFGPNGVRQYGCSYLGYNFSYEQLKTFGASSFYWHLCSRETLVSAQRFKLKRRFSMAGFRRILKDNIKQILQPNASG